MWERQPWYLMEPCVCEKIRVQLSSQGVNKGCVTVGRVKGILEQRGEEAASVWRAFLLACSLPLSIP